jgi:hypothetical protein
MTFRIYIQRLADRGPLTTVSGPISKTNEIEASTGAGVKYQFFGNRAE